MTVALIPARGGSKRIPRKNIREFCGQPIISYSIRAALDSNCFERVIVSTNDSEIAAIASSFGAEIPFTRPETLSDDFATTLDVIQHSVTALDLDDESVLCCLYATAPLVQKNDLRLAYKTIIDENLDFVFSATEYSFPIQRAFQLNADGRCEMFQPEHINSRSQDLATAYHDAGQFYFGKVCAYKEGKNFFHGSNSKPLLLPSSRVQDIDTLDDWKRAELIYRML